jgi:hypothetical protein
MQWVTRDRIHLDRVACPWLIRRFIDKDAEFIFVPWGSEDTRPADAIPFAIPGVDLGPHDESGTTFEKFIAKYKLDDEALNIMGSVISSGVHYALNKHTSEGHGDPLPWPEGIGLDAISEGMMLTTNGDIENLEASMLVYDALYAYAQAHICLEKDPSLLNIGLLDRAKVIKQRIRSKQIP